MTVSLVKRAKGERMLTAARRAQGFKSQDHLDAFYRARDHYVACRVCGTPGPAVPVDDGMQPTELICPQGRALEEESWRVAGYAN